MIHHRCLYLMRAQLSDYGATFIINFRQEEHKASKDFNVEGLLGSEKTENVACGKHLPFILFFSVKNLIIPVRRHIYQRLFKDALSQKRTRFKTCS